MEWTAAQFNKSKEGHRSTQLNGKSFKPSVTLCFLGYVTAIKIGNLPLYEKTFIQTCGSQRQHLHCERLTSAASQSLDLFNFYQVPNPEWI